MQSNLNLVKLCSHFYNEVHQSIFSEILPGPEVYISFQSHLDMKRGNLVPNDLFYFYLFFAFILSIKSSHLYLLIHSPLYALHSAFFY